MNNIARKPEGAGLIHDSFGLQKKHIRLPFMLQALSIGPHPNTDHPKARKVLKGGSAKYYCAEPGRADSKCHIAR